MAETAKKKTGSEPAEAYQTFVLRCSLVGEKNTGQQNIWRFYVESTRDPRRKKMLASLEGLMAYLQGELEDDNLKPGD